MNILKKTELLRFASLGCLVVGVVVLMVACSGKPASAGEPEENEDREAKALLQGIWMDEETEELAFQAKGDTIYYPDSTSLPMPFRIVADSIEMGSSKTRYAIVKQTEHIFWFKNQNGDVLKLVKSDDAQNDNEAFVHDQPHIMVYTEVVKRDSVVIVDGERYHWYVAINPTKYKVMAQSFSDDGMAQEKVYYDNIIHISLYQGARQLFSRDFRKQQYQKLVPERFLNQAVLGAMDYSHADAAGFHFNATLCIPDGASCYMIDNVISRDGKLKTKLLEY